MGDNTCFFFNAVKILFKNESKIKTFSAKQKKRIFFFFNSLILTNFCLALSTQLSLTLGLAVVGGPKDEGSVLGPVTNELDDHGRSVNY